MPIQTIPMQFYKKTRPIDNPGNDIQRFNTGPPPAKYYRNTSTCCSGHVTQVFKNVNCCYKNITRSANTAFPVGSNGKTPDYYHSNSQYLKNRCKTFKQRQFNFDYNQETKEGFANCADEFRCSKVVYNPNNSKFSTQGAVSSSERLLRLKYNNIRTTTKYNQHHISYRGDTSQNVFINKSPICKKC
jgi:hypothetical protein